ncbi:amidohydrolase family protein [Saliphagus sp. LR7]|uniref:N-acyl-D-amino-acid deacylase family protein n=1 Tax=Saliphagus sp. LR7 TaxID=2282654 RepID=UPI001E313E51|nr:D-aminoacylase [Saliphagus sp. LR7]
MTLLLKDARIVDGTGAPWYRGAVSVVDGQVENVVRGADRNSSVTDVYDLNGAVLCPGFIDLHSHADLEVLRDPSLEPKIRQGVTTEIVGQDGFSYSPMHAADGPKELELYLRGLSGRFNRDWPGMEIDEYLEAIESADPAPNVATLVGHGTVRYNVMGWEPRTATESELREMSDLVAESLKRGAVGFSTGLEYSPHRHATTREVQTLAAELSPHGLPFVAHIRSYSDHMWDALDEFIDIGAEEGVPVHLSHFKLGATKRGKSDKALHLVTAARERGVDFTADLYPYVPGSSMLLALVPTWAHAEGPERLLEHLEDDDARKQMKRELAEDGGSWDIDWDQVRISNVGSTSNEYVLGRTLHEIAAEQQKDPIDTMCDLLVEDDLEVTVVLGSINGSDKDICRVLSSELVGIGTDGIFGDRPHPRVNGTYPRILGEYVRERSLFSLEEAIRKMTSLPARIMGFERKGLIRPGMDADIVVFQPNQVGSDATVNQPNRFPDGIEHVLVDGQFVVRDGEITENRPGKALSSGSF